MIEFRFFQPVDIRYADIDAQRHVNNARHFTYMEFARAKYVEHLGLWDGRDFDNIGFILVEQSCTYLAPITYEQNIQVGVCTAQLGNKSFELAYSIQDRESGEELAEGRTVLVAYDYRMGKSISIPAEWRQRIETFEGKNP
jgi:acyl-CoA thioester hydrolase